MATQTFTVPTTPVGEGTTTFGPFTVPSGHTSYSFGLDLSAWQPTDSITIDCLWSQDAGATWQTGGSGTFTGGPHTDRQGNPVLPGWQASLPPDLGQGLQAKPSITAPSAGTIHGFVTLL